MRYIFSIKIDQEISQTKCGRTNTYLDNFLFPGLSRRRTTADTHAHAHIYN